MAHRHSRLPSRLLVPVVAVASMVTMAPTASGDAAEESLPKPRLTSAAAFDVSPPLRDLAARPSAHERPLQTQPELGPISSTPGHSADGALQATSPAGALSRAAGFEGLSNKDNPFQVVPPDPVGDVGPNHYVEMVNVVFDVFTKSGTSLLGPTEIGTLWDGFAIDDCTDLSGDPIVVYDQRADRWLLSQLTTRGFETGGDFYNCLAVSTTGDPTGTYYRYAFSTGRNFPDYPKWGVWSNSYVITTREFGEEEPFPYGIGVYALQRSAILNGQPASVFGFFLDSAVVPLNTIGDGLLPADLDGDDRPPPGATIPLVGTQDDDYVYGATFDALNIWELSAQWNPPSASLTGPTQLLVAEFDSDFPCDPPGSRLCIPQPGTSTKIDILSYRQRPTWRLAYRSFSDHEALVTNQSVEALPGVAGIRWYEIRRVDGTFSLYQQGTYAPDDGVHRWMGSIAMDEEGNMALGYSVSNGTTVYPGIRFTGRSVHDPLGQMTLAEKVIVNGSGSQLSATRWGDYTSMNIDVDDCTFWYVNEYLARTGRAPWQTRIASFQIEPDACDD
jgi:hypothetical protein